MAKQTSSAGTGRKVQRKRIEPGAFTVACPLCDGAAHAPCVGTKGHNFVHNDRIDAARKAKRTADEMGASAEALLLWMVRCGEARDTDLRARTVNLKFSAGTWRQWRNRVRDLLSPTASDPERERS